MLHAQRIHVKSHIIHHTIYKFGEKEDRYKKLRKDVIAAKKVVPFFGWHAPQSDACCCCYHNAVCLLVPAELDSKV